MNYRRGAAIEYKYRKLLLDKGWEYVQRTAGSHSPIDIIAVKQDEILFVQLKRSKTKSFSYKKELREFANWKVPISVTKRFVVWIDKIGWITLYEE